MKPLSHSDRKKIVTAAAAAIGALFAEHLLKPKLKGWLKV